MWYEAVKRKKRIIELLEKHYYLRNWMIAQEIFNYKTGKNKASTYMKKLYKQGMVKRFTCEGKELMFYLPSIKNDKNKKWTHWDSINYFHFNLLKQLKSWQKILIYEFEYNFNRGQADGFYVFQVTLEKMIKFFLEVENEPVEYKEIIKKIEQYNLFYDDYWEGNFIADPLNINDNTFPKIIFIVPNKYKSTVAGAVQKKNNNDLKIVVGSYDEVRNNAIKIITG